MARSIATLKARGTYLSDAYINEERFPPLTVAEQLELIARGEHLARYYRHPARVHSAVTGRRELGAGRRRRRDHGRAARAAYAEWAEEQHRLRQDFPGGTIGLGDEEYAAAMRAAAGATDAGGAQ